MKTIGLIGGMSWESTAVYYQILNTEVRKRLGGLHSAQLLVWSFDFAEIESLQASDDWETACARMIDAARRLEAGGAECLIIGTNTMHKMASDVQNAVDIPLIHIADSTAKAIQPSGSTCPLLLATAYTMEQDFYKGHLKKHHDIEVSIPSAVERDTIHQIIYEELCQGIIRPESKERYLEVVESARSNGADGVIFGCTEVGLLVTENDFTIPAFDTTRLHALDALDFALGG